MVKRRGTLKGRGVGPSKVAPEPMDPETIQVDVGEWERFWDLIGTHWMVEEGPARGLFETAEDTIEVTKEDGIPTKVVLDGKTFSQDEFIAAATEGDAEPEDEPEGGRRRSRLKKQARRTQRKRRNRKGKQLRKLTTRRR